jgi:hypothetical protein
LRRDLELSLQCRERALERVPDPAVEQQPVEEPDDPTALLVLHDESVHEAVAV